MAKKRNTAKRSKKKEKKEDIYAQKRIEILDAIHLNDIQRLRQLGKDPGGFLTNKLRQKAWSLLLLHPNWKKPPRKQPPLAHKDESQVQLDVVRSFNVYPSRIDNKTKASLKRHLSHVIVSVLRAYPDLHYYQGFHDICTVFLLVYEEHQHVHELVCLAALFYLRDAMLESLEPVLKQLHLLDALFKLEDEQLHQHLQDQGVLPFYCLSWVITWFSHDLDRLSNVTRLFDLFLCSNPIMPIFVSAALVLQFRDRVLKLDDASLIHHTLSKLPQQSFDLEHLIAHAVQMSDHWSPLQLQEIASQPLDDVSTINTFSTHWKPSAVDDHRQVRVDEACSILKLLPEERIPLPLATKASAPLPWKQLLVTTTFSLGTLAVFTLSYTFLNKSAAL
ncbi:RabGAP/TBC [Hesseltinella vesiculosa]|uniref:RabGAP/TBC n=1 Tax=Hesseltinella vesiculosa TaxID=101127 RepID=A0A1X2GL31_9FUNG|nr:RabGAP/TBC [Hesseltinella vesiculosa]